MKEFSMGLALSFFLTVGLFSSCAGVPFPYSYYSLDVAADCYPRGNLLGKAGKEGWKDLPLTECQPDAGNKIKCIVVLDADFYAAKSAFQKCETDLIRCQKGPPPK